MSRQGYAIRLQGLALLCCATLLATPARAAGPPSLEAFFAGTRAQSVAVSPDGRYLAMILTVEGRSFVAVRDLVQHTPPRAAIVTREKDGFDPQWCGWANATRLLCSLRGLDSDGGKFFPITRLVAVNADGSDMKVLANSSAVWSQLQDQIIDWTPGDPNTVLIELDQSEQSSLGTTADVVGGGPDGYPDVYALDVYSGRKRLVTRQRTPIRDFTTDGRGQVRLGYGTKDTKLLFFGRLDGERPWKELARVEAWSDGETFEPVQAIAGSNFAYAIRDYQGRRALWKIDLTDAVDPQLVFVHPEVDLDEPLWTRDRRLMGVSFETERPGVYYTDPDAARAYDAARRTLPERTNRIVDMTPDARTFLVRSAGDVAAPVFYLLDLRQSPPRLEAVAAAAPGLAGHALAPMQPIRYTARDGTQIPGYLTRPLQSGPADKPPLIVMPHGGPYARDSWGYDSWVQFLASHGYAMLQMEFRGSTGYGEEWWSAGFRDWGGLPYDDVIDGTRWALAQGYGDPARTCIVGASYGGYLALLAATRNDGPFKCAVSIAGVSDLIELRSDQRFFMNWQIANAGLATDWRKLKADSPRNHADSVTIPVLLIHGDRDYTVEVDHTKMMDAALKRAGKPHETLILEGADHYYREDAHRRALFTRLGTFLDAQLGGKAP
jgi:dipeptidyl aminopeptidase/acylaminoacyl peptidase